MGDGVGDGEGGEGRGGYRMTIDELRGLLKGKLAEARRLDSTAYLRGRIDLLEELILRIGIRR